MSSATLREVSPELLGFYSEFVCMSLLPLTDLRLLIRVTTTTPRLASLRLASQPSTAPYHTTSRHANINSPEKHSSHIIIEIGKTRDARIKQSTTAAQRSVGHKTDPPKKSQHKVTQFLDYHLQHPAPPESLQASPSHDPGPEPTHRRRRPLSGLLVLRLCYGRSTDRDTEGALI